MCSIPSFSVANQLGNIHIGWKTKNHPFLWESHGFFLSHSHKVMVKKHVKTHQFLQKLPTPRSQTDADPVPVDLSGCQHFPRKVDARGCNRTFCYGKLTVRTQKWRFGSDDFPVFIGWFVGSMWIFRAVLATIITSGPRNVWTPGRHQHVMPGFSQDFLDDKLRTQRLYRSVCHRDAFDQWNFLRWD